MELVPRILESLRRWGVVRSGPVEQAVRALPWDRILPADPGQQGYFHTGIPRPDGTVEPSPRMSVLLVELLEVEPGHRVALPSPPPRVLAALLEHRGAVVHDAARGLEADRSLELAPAPRRVALSPDGFTLHLSFEPHAEALRKRVPAGAGAADMGLEEVRLPPGADVQRPIRELLVLEGFAQRALLGRPRTLQDRRFADGVDSVWDPNPPPRPGPGRQRMDMARRWFHLAYVHQVTGAVGDAIDLYQASLDAHPTAEAHTFLGWTLALNGDVHRAIRQCEDAIDVDPTLGNPYNDIGAYLLELGQPERALPWFEQALRATRYEAPHFAHCNMGRALAALGRVDEARAGFERALRLSPGYRPAQEQLRRLMES